MILLSKEEFIEDNKDAITRFLRAIIEAEEYVNNNNAAAKDFIAKKYTYDSSYINDAWPKHNFEVELSQKLIVLMEDQARWRIENGLSDAAEVPNYLDYIYLDALDEVKPEAVGVID